jgi:predicted ArsR family transcriptional regulator
MEDLERRMPQEAPSDSARERILHLISTRSSTSTRRASDLEAQLHAAREQIDMLSTRMDGLADYARVMGTSNEAPPEYV